MKIGTKATLAQREEQSLSAVPLALLADLFDHDPGLTFFVKDGQGRYLAVNTSLVERCGLRSKSELIGKRVDEVFPGDLGSRPSGQDQSVLRTGRPVFDHLELHWYSPQKPGWCLTTKLPWRAANGNIIGLIGISRDVRAPEDKSEIPKELAAVLEHFEKNLSEPISPSSLAKAASMSPVRFARLIKRIYRLSPIQFITKARITAASNLLRETSRSVAEIAISCGYYDQSAFTRAFRATTGQTPTLFRKR